ncbi:MAG: hypothetical protein C4K60_06555 [Ideonella sp. MAG2]|nr:MAG: hypothetical protein C4K60_06555 [Ideonella sp. MAG2]
MRLIYFARVFFISFEFLALAISVLLVKFFESEANAITSALAINEELTKFAMLLPITLFAWCANEGRDMIFSNQDHSKILVNWPDYWKLKHHIFASLLFSLIFCLLSIFPWLSKSGVSTGIGLILFSSGCFGSILVAAQIYSAKMSINEVMHSD